MYRQLGLSDLLSAVKSKVKEGTGIECYDEAPQDMPGPYYIAEAIGVRPRHLKTMYRDSYTVRIHVFAGTEPTSDGLYELVSRLEKAMEGAVALPGELELLLQAKRGIQTVKTDKITKERHAILTYEFTVCGGLKCKI